jgi:trk system potassium uptake protein TrkA
MKNKKKRSFVVIGLGQFGGTVAPALAAMGDEVLGIDTDESLVRQYANQLSHCLIADARDENALKEAGIANYDVAVIAIGEDLEANILATMNAKSLGVPTVWVKAQSNTHHRILSRIGVDRIIRPERDMGMQIAEILHTPYVFDYIKLGSARYLVSYIIQHDMKKQPLGDLAHGKENGWHIVGVMRDSNFIASGDSDVILQEKDSLLVIGSKEQLRALSELL